ncbi:hypothetical protein QVD17_42413 [Tagetes erecta]|uniref:Uncharacterized protein n=1 Tax=Tagetes erecta TaxID=13708 RepID=A0AAD8N8M3_TARER|nr:hypothetical protein QVD17_42481 [Tagetes erecta]KAK1405900.1 hypothetical protein QVD17_42413 [Tagetes erecta]
MTRYSVSPFRLSLGLPSSTQLAGTKTLPSSLGVKFILSTGGSRSVVRLSPALTFYQANEDDFPCYKLGSGTAVSRFPCSRQLVFDRSDRVFIIWSKRIRTFACRYQKPMPYHLAILHMACFGRTDYNKLTTLIERKGKLSALFACNAMPIKANASVTLDSLRCSTELVGSTSTENDSSYSHSMDMLAFGMKMDEQALEPGTDEIRGKHGTGHYTGRRDMTAT